MAIACRSKHLESSVGQPFAVGEFAGLPTSARLHDRRARVRPHQLRIAMSGSTLAARRDTREGHRHPSSAGVAGGRVVLGRRDRMAHALEAKTGRPLWTFTTRARVDSSPAIAGGRVFVGSNDGRVPRARSRQRQEGLGIRSRLARDVLSGRREGQGRRRHGRRPGHLLRMRTPPRAPSCG